MKIKQNVRHFATKQALTTPGIATVVNYGLVRLHTRIFTGKADPAHAAEREDHLDGFFEATIDAYVAALEAGYTEAEAREITHIQGNFDFYNHGWIEMMEIPSDELEAHYERYRDFFETHDIAIDDPLGRFAPAGGIPDAPSTPEKLDDPEHPHAEGGFADDVYVEGSDGEVQVGGSEGPENVDVTDAPGLSADDSER